MDNRNSERDSKAAAGAVDLPRSGDFPNDRPTGGPTRLEVVEGDAAAEGIPPLPARDEWASLASELLELLDSPELAPALPAEQPPLVPPSPLRDVAPTAVIEVERFVMPAHVREARDASLSDLTKALLKMVDRGKFARRHAFDLHPDSSEGRLYRYDVEANRLLLSKLALQDPAALPPSSVEREQSARDAARVANAEVPGPEVRRGEPVRLAEAVALNRAMLAIVNSAAGDGASEASPVVPHQLRRPAMPGEPVPMTPDGRAATVEPEPKSQRTIDPASARTGWEQGR